MTPLRRRMLEDMQLRGLAPRTQQSYLAAVQQLALHFHRSPDLLTEEQLRQYFLYLHNEKRLAPNSVNLALNAVDRVLAGQHGVAKFQVAVAISRGGAFYRLLGHAAHGQQARSQLVQSLMKSFAHYPNLPVI